MEVTSGRCSTWEQSLAVLEGLSHDDLLDCIEGLLLRDVTRDHGLPHQGNLPADQAIHNCYLLSGNKGFQRRLRSVIYELFQQWSRAVDHPDYLSVLLTLVGRLRVSRTHELLTDYAIKGTFKGVRAGESELHLKIWRVLAGQGLSGRALAACTRDVEIPLYANICYRGLWQHDLNNGIKLLPVMIRHAMTSSVDVSGVKSAIGHYLSRATLAFVSQHIRGAFAQLDDPAARKLLLILSELGYTPVWTGGRLGIYDKQSEGFYITSVAAEDMALDEPTASTLVWRRLSEITSKSQLDELLPELRVGKDTTWKSTMLSNT